VIGSHKTSISREDISGQASGKSLAGARRPYRNLSARSMRRAKLATSLQLSASSFSTIIATMKWQTRNASANHVYIKRTPLRRKRRQFRVD
jgi:hypothetical protein